MTKNDFDALRIVPVSPAAVTSEMLADKTPRTLLYGYTYARDTLHVYLDKKATIVQLMYSEPGPQPKLLEHRDGAVGEACLAQAKRWYPQYCDYAFCRLLKAQNFHVVFTTWEDPKRTTAYVGRLLVEF